MSGRERKDAFNSRSPINEEHGQAERPITLLRGFIGKRGVLDGQRRNKVSEVSCDFCDVSESFDSGWQSLNSSPSESY